MKKLTIEFSEHTEQKLRDTAKTLGKSKKELLAEMIKTNLGATRRKSIFDAPADVPSNGQGQNGDGKSR